MDAASTYSYANKTKREDTAMPETLPPEDFPFTDTASLFDAVKWALLHMHDRSDEEFSTLFQKINTALSPFQFGLRQTNYQIGIGAVSVFTTFKETLVQMKSASHEEYSAF